MFERIPFAVNSYVLDVALSIFQKGRPIMARPRKTAISAEERENQLIAMAVDLAEKQIANGTASSQIITHFLKLGTAKEQLEREKLEMENKLIQAKIEALESSKRIEELYANAITAMREYQGVQDNGTEIG